jgi:predicted alpha-1,2-mannosidase
MKQKYLFLFAATLLLLVTALSKGQEKFTSFVNPFVGTSGHGHTFPAACLPFGMVQVGPDTGVEGWDWCSGYHASDSSIMGFSHNHMSGTGLPALGDVLIMPVTGEHRFEPGDKKTPEQGYRSRFSHETEVAKPGYYAVKLEDPNVYAEMTASLRVGFHRYTFQGSSDAGLMIDLGHGIGDKTLKSSMKIVDDYTVMGYRNSTAILIEDHLIFYCIKFSKPIKEIASYIDGIKGSEKSVEGTISKMILHFKTAPGEKLLVKVGLSTTSENGARNNIEKDVPDWDFDRVLRDADKAWEKELSKIEVETDNVEQKTTFYTALYHSLICPNLISDADGSYRGWDKKIHQDKEERYTNFSLWDTYRALHPLFSLTYPEKNNAFISTMMEILNQTGLLPVMDFGIHELNGMIGYHSVPVISQAILQGQKGFDYERAYNAMKALAMRNVAGIDYYKKLGFIPTESEINSVSKVLEYAYDDWCIAQVAKKLGKKEDYTYFIGRAKNYKNHFDASTGFMRGRHADGKWRVPFNPKIHSNGGGGDFTEANSWQYSFYVPQDVTGLINLIGSDKAFVSKLDSLFSVETDTEGTGVLDVTGLIGQYAHGNEPSHHTAYLYNFAGEPWKTQQMIHKINTTLYNSGREGLCGNDDCGQMSAWYVLSSLGFYQVTPGIGYYVIGTPSFKSARLHLPNGKLFTITAPEVSSANYYIQSAKLNGKSYSKSFLWEEDILKGGTLEFRMGDKPNVEWGNKPGDRPVSKITE